MVRVITFGEPGRLELTSVGLTGLGTNNHFSLLSRVNCVRSPVAFGSPDIAITHDNPDTDVNFPYYRAVIGNSADHVTVIIDNIVCWTVSLFLDKLSISATA